MPIKLMTFGPSHYCEVARWALDWHRIRYQEVRWPPGLHVPLARRLGAPRSSLPILQNGDALVQGSGAIIDWAEQQTGDPGRSLAPAGDAADVREFERRADSVIGVHVRRMMYAVLLNRHPGLVKSRMLADTSMAHGLLGTLMWPVTRRLMVSSMDAGPAALGDSRAILDGELDALDATLADGRPFLAGDRFSRGDLVVASLLAPVARPRATSPPPTTIYPPELENILDGWRDRPTIAWVNRLYETHRVPGP